MSLLADPTAEPFLVLGQMQRIWPRQRPNGLWYHPAGREVLIEGPAGTGKTTQDLMHDHWYASTFPRTRILWVRATLTSLRQSVLVTFENHVLRGSRHPCMHGRATRYHRTSYRYPNGSEIVLGGLDEAEKTYSMEYAKVTVFEALQIGLDSYEKLLRLLRWPIAPYRQIVAETNPGPEHHWLNQRALAGKMARIRTTHRDNPMMWDYEKSTLSEFAMEYVRGALSGMSGARRANLLDGVWCSAEGLIWPEYDPTLHYVERRLVPELHTYVASMDFGFNAPGCLQVWGTDGSKRWWRVAEVYRRGWNINMWANAAAELYAELRYRIGVADCAEPGSIEVLNQRLGRQEGRDSQAVFISSDKSRGKQHGLNQVRAMLDPTQDGGPRLFLVQGALRHRDQGLADEGRPTCTEEEIVDYTYRAPDDMQPLREDPDPRKANEGCDAMEALATWVYGKFVTSSAAAHVVPGSAADVLGWTAKRRATRS